VAGTAVAIVTVFWAFLLGNRVEAWWLCSVGNAPLAGYLHEPWDRGLDGRVW